MTSGRVVRLEGLDSILHRGNLRGLFLYLLATRQKAGNGGKNKLHVKASKQSGVCASIPQTNKGVDHPLIASTELVEET